MCSINGITKAGGRVMAKTRFSPEDRAGIMQNKNVLRVSETTITYNPAFKVEAVRASLNERKPPQAIFTEAGFDLSLIGLETPKWCLKRWRKAFKQHGEERLRNDRRGRGSTGRPTEKDLTVEEKLRRAEARIGYLEKENEFLKKLEALERGWSTEHRKSTH